METIELNRLCSHNILTAEEEILLGERSILGDADAIETLVVNNIRLVVSIAKGFVNSRLTLGDAISCGTMGLIHAAKVFDPKRGCRFSTNATWHIRKELYKAYWDSTTEAVSVPRHVSTLFRMERMGEPLSELQLESISSAGRARNKACRLDHVQSVTSFASYCHEEREDFIELNRGLVDSSEYLENKLLTIEDEPTDKEEAIEGLHRAIRKLSDEDQYLLKSRFGIAPYKAPMTYKEMGLVEGLTKQRMEQKVKRALDRLRAISGVIGLADY